MAKLRSADDVGKRLHFTHYRMKRNQLVSALRDERRGIRFTLRSIPCGIVSFPGRSTHVPQ